MTQDRLSNMLSSLKNAALARKSYIAFAHTKECEAVAKILKNAEFLSEVKIFKEKDKPYKNLRLDLAVDSNGDYRITDIQRLSKPGKRMYKPASELKLVAGGMGVLVVSTSQGVMSGSDARKKKLGGEVLCKVF